MYKALDVAKYIIKYSNDDINDESMSNLKLQKILYYVQAAFLVDQKKKCFDDKIISWSLGPVVPVVYDKYKMYGRRRIPNPKEGESLLFDSKALKIVKKKGDAITSLRDQKLIKKIVDSYVKIKDPFSLVKKTHEEEPWKKTLKNEEIKPEIIKDYYSRFPNKIYTF